MLSLLGQTQQQLLRELQRNPQGLGVAELVARLGVTRTAVVQHLTVLQQQELVSCGEKERSKGRPSQRYQLSAQGEELFPRQYALFAQLLLDTLAEDKKSSLDLLLGKMSRSVAESYAGELVDLKPKERVARVAEILSELGYQAEVQDPGNRRDLCRLEVCNCVYQQLAQQCPAVCDFDLNLLQALTGQRVEQQSSIIAGDAKCSFAVKKD